MEACNGCLMLEQRLRSASEDYVNLIVQHDQMIRDGRPEASILDNPHQEGTTQTECCGEASLGPSRNT